MEIVSATNLKKTYGDFTAVSGIDFSIQQGEIFGFLGPNGAGKTSTLNMLIGLSRPMDGNITIDGIDTIKQPKKAQKIMGVVPDESNLYNELDGFGNLCFNASLYGMRKAESEKRAKQLLEQFNLLDAGKHPFGAYSKGMHRKLTIAAGIIHSPRILFLDELVPNAVAAMEFYEKVFKGKREDIFQFPDRNGENEANITVGNVELRLMDGNVAYECYPPKKGEPDSV